MFPVSGFEEIRQAQLEEWAREYLSQRQERVREAASLHDGIDDTIDDELVEQKIRECMQGIQVQDGYCSQEFLKTWCKNRGCQDRRASSLFDLPWHVNLTQFEASSRRGCRFCKLWLQYIPPSDLQTFRKIENDCNIWKTTFYINTDLDLQRYWVLNFKPAWDDVSVRCWSSHRGISQKRFRFIFHPIKRPW